MNRDQFEINHANDDQHLDNLNQYPDHRHSGDHSQQHNRPRGMEKNMKNSSSKQYMGNNFSDYMPYSASANNIDNRMPFIKTQSFSNSKLRNPNRNSNMSQQSQQQHQQNFSDYQLSSETTKAVIIFKNRINIIVTINNILINKINLECIRIKLAIGSKEVVRCLEELPIKINYLSNLIRRHLKLQCSSIIHLTTSSIIR